jgi:tetratricopeptide (TPR) repeat protein
MSEETPTDMKPLKPATPTEAAQPEGASAQKSATRLVAGISVLLALAVFAVFGQTVRYAFVTFDDDMYVYKNPVVVKGFTFQGLHQVFTHQVCDFYHPLTMMSLMLDDQIYGLNAGGYHLTNVLLHAATAILLFLVLRRMTGALWSSAFVAAVFAIHPLRVESVAWVTERKDVLSGVFFVLTVGAYGRYVEQSKVRGPRRGVFYGLTVMLFALGLLSKPTLVTVPFLLLLLDYWPLGRVQDAGPRSGFKILLPLVIEKLPLFALSAAACVATIFTQQRFLASVNELPLVPRIGYAAVSYFAYLGHMFYPAGLIILYPYSQKGLPWLEVVPALVLLAGVSVAVLLLCRQRPYLLVGWLWYLGMLVPMIGVVHAGSVARADRFTYLAQVGVYIMITWAVEDWAASGRHSRRILSVGAIGVIVALMICAGKQTSYWRDSELLWNHTLASDPGNYFAYNNLGVAMMRSGRLTEAIEHYQIALEINTNYAEAHYNLGWLLDQQGRPDEAIVHYQKALKSRPDYAEIHEGFGDALAKMGQVDEAIAHYQKAVQLRPDYAEAHNNLANMLVKKDQFADAIVHFQKAIDLNPNYTEAHYNLGVLFGIQGRLDEAVEHYQKAIELRPGYADAHGNLANVLAAQGKLNEAIREYQRTLELTPNSAQAHYRYGQALQSQRNFGAAKREYQKVLELAPRHVQAYLSLAWLLATCPDDSLRDGNRAVDLAQQAEQISGGESPQMLDTLGVAYAAAGRYDEAVETARRALDLPATRNNQPLAEAIQTRLKLYEAHLPYHEKP